MLNSRKASDAKTSTSESQVLSPWLLRAGAAVLTAALATWACGPLKGKEPAAALPTPTAESAAADSSSATASAGTTLAKSFELVADYKFMPVSVLIIRNGSTRADPFNTRINAALPVLISKLWNLASTVGSAKVMVLDHALDTIANTSLGINNPNDAYSHLAYLSAEKMSANEFYNALESRIQRAGIRGGQAEPGSVLMAALEESKKPSGGYMLDFFAPDRFIAVIYMSVSSEADEYSVDDITQAFADRNGHFMVSALAPTKEGCLVEGSTPPVETNPLKKFQRNLEIKLQESTGGYFGSICARSYAIALNDTVDQGTGTSYFAAKMPTKFTEINSIESDGVPIKEFKYAKGGTDIIQISTKVASGKKVTVNAMVEPAPGEIVVGTDPGDKVPQPGDSQLSPAEAAFITTAKPKLDQYCDSCHSSRPYNTRSGYPSAFLYKAEIARRVALPITDPQKMPPNVIMPDADKNIIIQWGTN